MNLNELAEQIFKANKIKGFHDEPKETGTYLMLMVSELGEALEADRKGNFTAIQIDHVLKMEEDRFQYHFPKSVKDTFEDEIADTIIRLFDYCGLKGIDIQSHILAKLRYNRSRPHKHGKAY